jgi:CheY-like chemotaxis protein
MSNSTIAAIEGLRLFVVEDDAFIAMMIEDLLEDLGCDLVGLAGTLPQALSRVGDVAAEADGAILDVNLGGGQDSYPFADALIQAGVPFVFTTGYAPDSVESRFHQVPILPKPVRRELLVAALADFRARDARRARGL